MRFVTELLLVFTLMMLVNSCSSQTEKPQAASAEITSNAYFQKINELRQETQQDFLNKETSPLTEEDRKNFLGLNYYQPDSAYRVQARFTKNENPEPFKMQTTTAREPNYIVFGWLNFELQGDSFRLEVYKSIDKPLKPEYADLLFIPFYDLTNNTETYGGGRYLELHAPKNTNETWELDFNLAYNPYCAYNYKYSCPIPPIVNTLDVAIMAGEKRFHLD